jgi:cytochrome b561
MYDDKMWDFHKLLGYTLSFLLLSRVLIELTQQKDEKMKSRFKNALFAYRQPGADKKELRHYLLTKVSYILFYLLIFCMATTGLIIAFGADLGLANPFRHTVKEVHGFIQYLIYAFVVIHLAGVILADIGKSKGIISGMVNGGE